MKLRDELTIDFAGLLLDSVRDNGWLTCVSNDAGINRVHLNRKGIGQLRVHQVLRLLVVVCYHTSRHSEKLFMAIWWRMGQRIMAMADSDNYFDFVERR